MIALAAGEPDFDTPDNIKEAAARAMREGKTKYTDVDGIPELKDAVVAKFKRENGLDVQAQPGERVAGRQDGDLQRADGDAQSRRRSRDPVAYWVSYPDIMLFCGGAPVFAPTTLEGIQSAPARIGEGADGEDEVADPQLAVEPFGRGLHPGRAKALAEVLLGFRTCTSSPTTCTST